MTPVPNIRASASHRPQYSRYIPYVVKPLNAFIPRTVPVLTSLASSVVSSKTRLEFKAAEAFDTVFNGYIEKF